MVPTATDNCTTTPTIHLVSDNTVADETCANAYVRTRVWNFTDGCGNTSANFTQTITVIDNTAPVITSVTGSLNVTIQCSDVIGLGSALALVPTATDNCTTTPTIHLVSDNTVADETCANAYVRTRVWNFTDGCGNTSANFTQTITVIDNTAPVITTVTGSLNATLQCSDLSGLNATLALVPTATDNCTSTPTIHLVSDNTVADETCANAYVRTRVWNFTDGCGNTSANFTQTITVIDNTAPTFTRPADITIFTTASCTYDASVAATGDVTNEADNCSTGLQATYTDAIANGTCEGSKVITRTWHLVDNCGNAAADQVQTITVTDNIAPTFTRPANITIYTTASCTYDASIAVTGDVTNEADNCSTGLQATYTDVIANGPCQGSKVITRTWHLIDNCGNAAADQVQTITVLDNIAPTFTRPADITIYTTADCSYDASVAATGDVINEADNCSTQIQATYTDAIANGPCQGSKVITRTWHLVDNCGNAAADQVQTITVLDNIAPTFTRPADITIYTTASCTYDASVAATGDVTNEADNCSTGLQATYTDAIANGTCEGSKVITRTWHLVDNCGNAAADQVQTITVLDNIAPTFTSPANITIFTTANCTYDASVAVTGDVTNEADNCSTGLQATYTDAITNGQCQGSKIITRTWHLVDNCGNAAADQIQTITVLDNIAPTFTRPADITIYTTSSCTYDASVAATGDVTNEADNCSTGLQATYTDAIANGPCEGSKIITRTWHLVDNCGNAAADQVQIITVTDNIPPTFTRPVDMTIYANANCTYDASLQVTGDVINEADNCSTGLQATYTDAIADGSCQGSKIITRTWHLVDNCGNAAADQIQTITVSDTIAPVLTCPTSITVNNDPTLCGANVTVAQPTFVENCSTVTLVNSFNQTADASGYYPVGTTTVIWTATDACGNSSTCSMTVTVVDNEAPIVSCPPDVISCSLEFNLGTPVVSDNCGVESVTNDAPETFPIGITIVTWTVTDIHGNISTCTQSVSLANLSATATGTTTLSCYNSSNGIITVTAIGGIAPYSYSLNGSTPQSSNEFTDLPAGTYTITVSDATNQCEFNLDFTIGIPDSISVDLAKIADANCAGKRDGEIGIEVTGGVGPYQYSWSNGETTETISNLDAGEYTVTVTDNNGCELRYTQAVIAGSHEEPLVINNAFSPNGDGINDYWVIKNIELYPDNEVIVLNRWGNEIYTMKNYSNNWDGSKLSEGTYLYILKVDLCGEPSTLNGYITVVR
jgi:gliding motility-associated-like protein